MSSGAFVQSIYADDAGRFYNIRIQPETLLLVINAVTNTAGAGPVDQPVSARARGSRRAIGATARSVSLRFDAGMEPAGYSGDPVSVPIMTLAVFTGITPGQTGTYLGAPVTVISKTAEQLR